ncbi:MAG: hypothetical protein NVSMB1_21590 [Polyangiales bacterium]
MKATNAVDSAVELARAEHYYDHFAESYEAHRDGRGRYHDLLDDGEVDLARRYVEGRDLLEVGCGTGLILRRLRPFARRAMGVDLSRGMLEYARKRGLDVVQGSAASLPFADASFDVVVSFKTLPHVPDLGIALSEMARVTRKGGVIIAELYNPHSLRAWIKEHLPARGIVSGITEGDVHCRFDDDTALRSRLPKGCEVERIRGMRTVVPFAAALETWPLGSAFEWIEWRLCDTRFAARRGGFVSYVIRRN